MAIAAGNYELGNDNGTLLVRTGRAGVGSKLGHDLTIRVTKWSATVSVADDPSQSSMTLTAQVSSMEVAEGTGGVKPLTDSDKADIKKNIVKKILGDTEISFRSTSITASGDSGVVKGELTVAGKTAAAEFQATDNGNGQVTGTGTIVQSDFGIKPFTALMGALKIKDEVEIELTATLG